MISGAVMTTGQNTAELDSTGYIADRVYLVEPSIKVLFPQGNFWIGIVYFIQVFFLTVTLQNMMQ